MSYSIFIVIYCHYIPENGNYKIKKKLKHPHINYPIVGFMDPLCGPKKGSKSSLLNIAVNKEMHPVNFDPFGTIWSCLSYPLVAFYLHDQISENVDYKIKKYLKHHHINYPVEGFMDPPCGPKNSSTFHFFDFIVLFNAFNKE